MPTSNTRCDLTQKKWCGVKSKTQNTCNDDGGSSGNKGKFQTEVRNHLRGFIITWWWGPQNSQKPFCISLHEHPFSQPHEEGHRKHAWLLGRSWSFHQAWPTRRLASHHPVPKGKRILRCVSCSFFRDRISSPSSSLRLHHSWLVSFSATYLSYKHITGFSIFFCYHSA